MNRRKFLAGATTVAATAAIGTTGASLVAMPIDPIVALYDRRRDLIARVHPATPDDEFNAIFAAADAIEAEIWRTPAVTLDGLLVKARLTEHFAIPIVDTPLNELDWDQRCVVWLRQDIERMIA